MSTKYFLLTKNFEYDIGDDRTNKIINPAGPNVDIYLLPQTNIDYYKEHGLFEKHLIDWCKQFCGPGLFIDIGAHTGTYSIALAKYVTEVHSFEPQRMTYYALCGSIAMSDARNVTAYNIGLGSASQAGNRKLNIRSEDGGGSSLLPFENDPVIGQENVVVRTLDSFDFRNVKFIKVDVEGNEIDVLKGAEQTIKNSFPTIVFESNFDSDAARQRHDDLVHYLVGRFSYNKILRINGMNNMFIAEPPTEESKRRMEQRKYYDSLLLPD